MVQFQSNVYNCFYCHSIVIIFHNPTIKFTDKSKPTINVLFFYIHTVAKKVMCIKWSLSFTLIHCRIKEQFNNTAILIKKKVQLFEIPYAALHKIISNRWKHPHTHTQVYVYQLLINLIVHVCMHT